MRFSIRAVLALTFLVGLGLLAWQTKQTAERSRALVAQLVSEIRSLETQTRVEQSAAQLAMLHSRDEYQSLRAARERAVAHFPVIRGKYSTMEPPQIGELAIRSQPSLQSDSKPAPVVFRLLVPQERKIWLKFGVHPVDQSVSSSNVPDDSDLLTESPLGISGPYEIQLPTGDQTLEIFRGSVLQGVLPIKIKLGEQLLFDLAFSSPDIRDPALSHVSAKSQINIGPSQPLPWLLTANFNLHDSETQSHGMTLWLADEPSGFQSFPGN